MDSSLSVTLPSKLLARCKAYGERVISDYAFGMNTASRSVSTHRADVDSQVQILGRAAECAVSLWCGLDIEQLNWTRGCDGGFDVLIERIYRADVKATSERGRLLIWPIGKRHIFESKQFDLLILVRRSGADEFLIRGWSSKVGFKRDHEVADGLPGITDGTWYMHERDLNNPYLLRDGGCDTIFDDDRAELAA